MGNGEVREDWQRHLRQLPEDRLIAAANKWVASRDLRYRTVPQSGLGMLRLSEAALGDSFYLGEFPLAVAAVEIEVDGCAYPGAAQVMSSSIELVTALAVFDAVLTHDLEGSEQARALLEEGRALSRTEDRERAAMLERTVVDFELLETSDHKNTHGST